MMEVVSSNCTPPTAPSTETMAWPAVDVDDMAGGDIGAPHPECGGEAAWVPLPLADGAPGLVSTEVM